MTRKLPKFCTRRWLYPNSSNRRSSPRLLLEALEDRQAPAVASVHFAIIGDYGLMSRYDFKPMYYVYPMYKRFGDTLTYAASDDPMVSIFAHYDGQFGRDNYHAQGVTGGLGLSF